MADSFTPTTDAVAIPTVIAQEVIRLWPALMGITRFVSKDVDWTGKDFATYGDTLDIVKPGTLAVKTKAAGADYETQAPSATKLQVSLNRHKYIEVLDEDITKMLRKPDLQQEYARRMAMALAEEVDSYVFSLHPSITNTVTFNKSSASTIDASMRLLRSRFVRNRVPVLEPKALFADTSVVDDLLSVDKYTNRDYLPDSEAVKLGAIKTIYNNNIVESNLIDTEGSPVSYHNIATTKYGFVVVNRPMPLDGNGKGVVQTNMVDPMTGLTLRLTEGYDNKQGGTTFRLELVYGAALCDTTQVIEVESF